MKPFTLRHRSTILLVEDSPEDTEATMRAFDRSGLANPVHHSPSGDDALDYLRGEGAYDEPHRPGVILLDLNMPGMDGCDVLRDLRADPELRCIPVIVLTTSNDGRDVKRCYDLGANSYVCKPVNVAGFLEAVERIHGYWFEVCLIPDAEREGRA